MYPEIKAPKDLSVFDIFVSNVIDVFSSIAFFDCFKIFLAKLPLSHGLFFFSVQKNGSEMDSSLYKRSLKSIDLYCLSRSLIISRYWVCPIISSNLETPILLK